MHCSEPLDSVYVILCNYSCLITRASLVPRPPPFFCSSVFVQYNTRKHFRVLYRTQTEEQKNRGGLGTRLHKGCIISTVVKVGGGIGQGPATEVTHLRLNQPPVFSSVTIVLVLVNTHSLASLSFKYTAV